MNQEIIAGNIKIAVRLFKAATIHGVRARYLLLHAPELGEAPLLQKKEDGRAFSEEELLFHDSYDWLMPAYCKIASLRYKGFPLVFTISSTGAHIAINPSNVSGEQFKDKAAGERTVIADTLNCNYFNDFPGAERVTHKMALFEALVAFVNWYEKNEEHIDKISEE